MTTIEIEKIQELLTHPKKIILVTHWSPDGDAIGSSLGLYNYLLLGKHDVKVIVPNDYPPFLNWMEGNDKILNYQKDPVNSIKSVNEAEIIFLLDFNSLKRIDELGKHIEESAAFKIMIDHHLQPDPIAQIFHHDVKKSSTAELVFDFICLLGDENKINKSVAECLYTGIMTDTGSFRFPSTSAQTHRAIACLLEVGANHAEIHNRIYDDNSEDKIHLLGFCLNEKLKVLPQFNTAYITLDEAEQKKFKCKKGDTEGFVNYALSIRDIKLAAFFAERDGLIKTSFRSKGNFDVNLFARKHFDGGGHKNAAGGASQLSMKETVDKFILVLEEYKSEII
ncbi:MAG: bifunctional oligoribonuclease/PAP phosphatase NrnA [Bacteroidia bacterium]